jgi:hypothetical protein
MMTALLVGLPFAFRSGDAKSGRLGSFLQANAGARQENCRRAPRRTRTMIYCVLALPCQNSGSAEAKSSDTQLREGSTRKSKCSRVSPPVFTASAAMFSA